MITKLYDCYNLMGFCYTKDQWNSFYKMKMFKHHKTIISRQVDTL